MSNQQKTDFDQHDLKTQEQEHWLILGDALNRLRKNPDFKLVIEENYLRNSVLSKVSLLAVDQIKKEGRRVDLFEDIVAASSLYNWFLMVDGFAEGARNPILSDAEEEEIMKKEKHNATAGLN